MQVVIALPTSVHTRRLEMPVCGIPLLERVIASAVRAGGTKFLFVIPPDWEDAWISRVEQFAAAECGVVDVARVTGPFCPSQPGAWHSIADRLDDQFLWLPCDYVAYKPSLIRLLAGSANRPTMSVRFTTGHGAADDSCVFKQPVVLAKRDALKGTPDSFEEVVVEGQAGVTVRGRRNVAEVETQLVRHSGKPTDGIYSRFNRRLCWPSVQWLSRTRITPNSVSFGGLAVAFVSAVCFAYGTWAWDIAGAVLFFISGLFDEIDGMLARLKFQASAFGCWLETFVDYTTYLLAFAGMTVGGYHRGGPLYVALGAALVAGCLLSFFVISVQRKLATPSKPSEYYQSYLKTLDRDSGNPISKAVRNLQFLLRKGVLIHYMLLFAILNIIPLFFFLSAVGANAAWMLTVYMNRRFYLPRNRNQGLAHACPARLEVEQ